MQIKWKKDRKAVELPSNTLIIIIIAFIGFFFVFLLVRNLMAGTEEGTIDLTCKASVAARARSVIQMGSNCVVGFTQKACLVDNPLAKIDTIPLLCRTKEREISGDKSSVMGYLAKSMEACWSMFGEGKFPYVIEDSTAKSTCFPCYIIMIKKIGKGKDPIEGAEFVNFLRDNEITYLNTTESYFDYMTNHGGIPGALIVPKQIQENKAYYVMYSDPPFDDSGYNRDGKSVTPNGIYLIPVDELNSKEFKDNSIQHSIINLKTIWDKIWGGTDSVACKIRSGI